MPARFPRCAYGPFAARAALRSLLPDERVRTWWVGTRRGAWGLHVLAGVMRLLPGVLPGAGGRASRGLVGLGAVLVIETDRRLLVLAGDDPSRVVLERPWHRVEVGDVGKRVRLAHTGGVLLVRRVWGGRSVDKGDSPPSP